MTLFLPPVVVVPVHGCVQLGSNAGRAVVLRKYIQWRFILWVTLGAVIGSALGGRFASLLPERWFAATIGLFVLVTTWLPQPKAIAESRVVQFAGGMVVSALGMVVGAAGPLVAAFVRGIADRRQLVATHAMLNTFVHVFKVAVFVAMGFAFAQYLYENHLPKNGIRYRVHHPMVLGVKVWAFAHLLANNTLADVLLFGSFLVWAVLNFRAARERDRVDHVSYSPGTGGGTVKAVLAGIVAWAVLAFWLHGWLFGVSPFGA